MIFSILIPVYNAEKYLKFCIESVLKQDFNSYEIVLVDDGSTDASGKICDEYAARYNTKIRVLHQENHGLFYTRRRLFAEAKGEYCICLDADDFLSISSLQILEEKIRRFSPDFILYDLYYYDEKKDKFWKSSNPLESDYKYNDLQFLKNAMLELSFSNWSLCAKCVKNKIVNSGYNFQKFYNISYGEDTVQSVIIYNKALNFIYTDKKIYNYRTNSGMTGSFKMKFLHDFYEVSKFMRDECKNWDEHINKKIDIYYSKLYYSEIIKICKFATRYSQVSDNIKEVNEFLDKNNIKIEKNVMKTNSFSDQLKKILIENKLYCALYFLIRLKEKFT